MSVTSKAQLESNLVIVEDGKATSYFEDYLYNNTLVGDAVSDAVSSTVSVDSPDAPTSGTVGVRLAGVITLANEMKADVNTLVTDVNNAIAQVNALLASLRDAERLDE